MHWLAGEEVDKAICTREWAEETFLRQSGRVSGKEKSQKLRETVGEHQDMLFCVREDGSVVVWGVQVRIAQLHDYLGERLTSLLFST